MAFNVVSVSEFPQATFQRLPQENDGEGIFEDFSILGGLLSDLKHAWQAKGPCLEVRDTKSGLKVGSWLFGCILKDSNTTITAVKELKRANGAPSLLIVATYCPLSGGLISVFNFFSSKVYRVIHIAEQITNLHIIDPGIDILTLPDSSPLKYFDGIVAVGTQGGNLYLLDLCKQLCENAIENLATDVRDEVNPCEMMLLDKSKLKDIKKYIERAMEREEHLALHLNVVLNPSTEHFTLKGEEGDDRVHVSKSEVEVSALYYSQQIAALLIGYNFGAFQMWDLRLLELLYTSPMCEGHIPITHFTVQEPADDPKAYCYVWVSYSHNLIFHTGLPFAVMYSFYFDRKKSVSGYGTLYENFQHCSIRFQLELADTQSTTYKTKVKGGTCLGLQTIHKQPANKDVNTLALCLISWLIWDGNKEVHTAFLLFDLNQWYKEQMPRMPNWNCCSNYMIKNSVCEQLLDFRMDERSLSQFMGVQRLEEHFCPTSLSFDLWGVSETSIIHTHNKGIQKAFLEKLINDQHLALVRPEDYADQIGSLGLVPIFVSDASMNSSSDLLRSQRELLLSVVLEQKLLGWLCQTSTKLANNAFNAAALGLQDVLNWAFERVCVIKQRCDWFCAPLFDYSGTRLDENTVALVVCGTNQMRDLCNFFQYVLQKLRRFVTNERWLERMKKSLENIVVYFEVLLWMVHIGLLPEFQSRAPSDSLIAAPYFVNDLTEYYNRKRADLRLASKSTFVEHDCLLFIDNLINNKVGDDSLRKEWQIDGGSGLYPPPSLQSVLRTYLLDDAELTFKHSLVTYTLLDVAMTVDEHNKIIQLLLKFPQIFDVSQSNIKIIQGFWHLDHDDYETALLSLMDPCVLREDLQGWHHSVMMRSLLMQDQTSLALWYWQVRKPAIQDETDLFTVISLLISRNMLDEAFKFRLQHKGSTDYELLNHIFNECNKSGALHQLLYRHFDGAEEQTFLKYLHNANNPKCEDLQVFYYLLRSRFLEAFDTYDASKRKQPDNQGLLGQRGASTADNVVKLFKSLLPDVNRNLLELVRKERSNLWMQVDKPTPLSVFVHNTSGKVQYKSSVIFAALSKAKQTFTDTSHTTNTIFTEETPFLRTPTAKKALIKEETPLLTSRVIEQNELGEELGPTPCKQLKLTPRASKIAPKNVSLNHSLHSKLSTPIIKRKRKSSEQEREGSSSLEAAPHSILKSATRTLLEESVWGAGASSRENSLQVELENSQKRSKLTLSPRKSLRTPLKVHVKFDDIRYSGSSTERNSTANTSASLISTKNVSYQSKNSTASTMEDDVFYSPESSHVRESTIEETSSQKSISQSKERLNFDDSVAEIAAKEPSSPSTDDGIFKNDLSSVKLNFQSPKSRRSYKRSFGEHPTPIRSSPRLAKKDDQSPATVEQTKPRARKSLARAVLEQNTFSRLSSSTTTVSTSTTSSKILLETSGFSFLGDTTTSSLECGEDLDASYEAFLKKCEAAEVEKRENVEAEVENAIEPSLVEEKTISEDVEAEVENAIEHFVEAEVEKNDNLLQEQLKTTEHVEHLKEEDREDYEDVQMEVDEFDDSKLVSMVYDDLDGKEAISKDEVSAVAAVNVVETYDDVSSASEDVKEILLNKDNKNNDDRKTFAADLSSFSTSNYQTERNLQVPDNILEGDDSVSNGQGEFDKAFIESADVIEISSGDEREEEGTKSPDYNFDVYSSSSSSSNTSSLGSSRSSIEDQDHTSPKPKSEDSHKESVDQHQEELFDQETSASNDDEENSDTNVSEPATGHSGDDNSRGFNQSVGVQCTLANPSLKEAFQEEEVEEEEEQVKEDDDLPSNRSVGLQCTLAKAAFKDEDGSEETPNEELSSRKSTPYVLRTVKKTYKGPKDATPKLAVHLIKRTYARKKSASTLFDDEEMGGSMDVEEAGGRLGVADQDGRGSSLTMAEEVASAVIKMPIGSQEEIGGSNEATPHLAVQSTKRTYSRKRLDISLVNKKDSSTIVSEQPMAVDSEEAEDAKSDVVDEKEIIADEQPPNDVASETNNKKSDISSSQYQQSDIVAVTKEVVTTEADTSLVSASMFNKTMLAKPPAFFKLKVEGRNSPKVVEEEQQKEKGLSELDIMETSLLTKVNKSENVAAEIDFDPLQRDEITVAPPRKHGRRKVLSEADLDVADTDPPGEARDVRVATSRKSTITSKKMQDVKLGLRRTRRASADQPITTDLRPRSGRVTRSRSVDLDDLNVDEINMKFKLGCISEVPTTSQESPERGSKAGSHLGDYTTSRRLTRRQAKMLDVVNKLKRIEEAPPLDELDPMHLLDKREFDGKPDPEEADVYEQSSPSTASEASSTAVKSAASQISGSSTPKKGSKGGTSAIDSSASGIKGRLRRQSTDALSVASETSDSPGAQKRTRKGHVKEDSPMKNVVHNTRSRSNSVSSIKSNASDSSIRTTRSKRINLPKTDLPEIVEEEKAGGEEGNSNKASKRGQRKN